MGRSSFIDDIDSGTKKIGRPRVIETPHCFSNIPFTEEEFYAIEKIKAKLGGDKRHWIKKWIAEGIENANRAIKEQKL